MPERCQPVSSGTARWASEYSRGDKNRLKGKFGKEKSQERKAGEGKKWRKIIRNIVFGGKDVELKFLGRDTIVSLPHLFLPEKRLHSIISKANAVIIMNPEAITADLELVQT